MARAFVAICTIPPAFLTTGTALMFKIQVEPEDDGRWVAEVVDLSGVMAYGASRQEAIDRVQALALRVLADRLEHGESIPTIAGVFAVAP